MIEGIQYGWYQMCIRDSYHTDEKFPYFGHHTENLDMLELYEESAIEGMEPWKLFSKERMLMRWLS